MINKPHLKNTKVGNDANRYWNLGKKIVLGLNSDQTAYRLYEDLVGVVKKCMEMVFGKIFPEVPFLVTPEIRDTWGLMLLDRCR